MEAIFNIACSHLGLSDVYAELSFVAPRKMKRLNMKFRGVKKVTDVLSFPALDLKGGKKPCAEDNWLDIHRETGRIGLGDIVICKRVAKRQARKYGHSFEREMAFLYVHGLLHLLGYDHIEPKDEEEMTRLQREILEKAGV